MQGRLIAGFVFATSLAVALQTHAVAQQRGQQPAGLTQKQWLESKEAQAHVAAAMAIAKPDLLQEAANLCSARGPQPPAVLRQEAGLPAVPRQTLVLGDTTVTMLHTPGHTPGSIALLFPVRDRGKPYTAFMPSGGFAAPDRQSLASLERAIDLAKKQKAVALLSGHPGIYGDTLAWMETRRKNPNS